MGFQFTANYCYICHTLNTNGEYVPQSRALTLTGSTFHRVGAATEKSLVPTFNLTLATKSRFELDDRSCLGSLAGASSDCKYAVCLDESAYRPVSLTLVIKDHILDFLVRHKLLHPSQLGFLKARSYLTNMICFLEETTRWLYEGSPVYIIYLDSQKLFSKKCHIKEYFLN